MTIKLLGVTAVLCWAFHAIATCSAPQLKSEDRNALTERQPRIQWTPVAHSTGYNIGMVSRAPEGRVLAMHDTFVKATEFRPPRPLTDYRAKVTVRLRAVCGKETSPEAVSSFLIDTSPTCRLKDLNVAADQETARVGWQHVAGALSYDVRAYGLVDARLIASQETRGNQAQFPLAESAVIAVRPACTSGLGEAVYQVLPR